MDTWPILQYLMLALQPASTHLVSAFRNSDDPESISKIKDVVKNCLSPVMSVLQHRSSSGIHIDPQGCKGLQIDQVQEKVRADWCTILCEPAETEQKEKDGSELLHLILGESGPAKAGSEQERTSSRHADRIDVTKDQRLTEDYQLAMSRLVQKLNAMHD